MQVKVCADEEKTNILLSNIYVKAVKEFEERRV